MYEVEIQALDGKLRAAGFSFDQVAEEVRRRTGDSLLRVHKALIECDGNPTEAEALLRKLGMFRLR